MSRLSSTFYVIKSQDGEKLEINWGIHKDNIWNIIAHTALIFPQLVFWKTCFCSSLISG